MFMLLKNAKLLNIKQLCKLNTLYFLNQLHALAEQINNFPLLSCLLFFIRCVYWSGRSLPEAYHRRVIMLGQKPLHRSMTILWRMCQCIETVKLLIRWNSLPMTWSDCLEKGCIRMHWDMQDKGLRFPLEFCLFTIAEWKNAGATTIEV